MEPPRIGYIVTPGDVRLVEYEPDGGLVFDVPLEIGLENWSGGCEPFYVMVASPRVLAGRDWEWQAGPVGGRAPLLLDEWDAAGIEAAIRGLVHVVTQRSKNRIAFDVAIEPYFASGEDCWWARTSGLSRSSAPSLLLHCLAVGGEGCGGFLHVVFADGSGGGAH